MTLGDVWVRPIDANVRYASKPRDGRIMFASLTELAVGLAREARLLALRRINSGDSPRWEVPLGPPSHLHVCADEFSEAASVHEIDLLREV